VSVSYLGKVTNWPDDIIGRKIRDEIDAQWGEMPGEVVSFDPQKQTATIKPLYKPHHNGKAIDMPNLLEVPVRFTRAGNGGITFPVKAGDRVSLRPMMKSTDKFHSEGDGEATDARAFSLADMEAFLDGGESVTDPIKNFDNANMHVRFDPEGKFGMKGSQDGKVKIEGSQGNIYELLAQVVELLGQETTTVQFGSSAGIHPLTHQAQFAEIAAKLRAMAL
jgi:hypothetical protein